MTIIQPHKNTNSSNFLVSILMMFCVVVALWGIFLYNQLVDVRHEISGKQDDIQKAEVTNAELKNSFYNLTGTESLKSAADAQTLILEQNPQYVKLGEVKQLTSN
ncbi:MAG: hypothetical protein WC461_02565 [Candidatus Paceibacterota bacterium]